MGKGKRQKQALRPSISPIENTNAMMMPLDLLVEILLRLSVEDIARCRCVSKLWYSLLRRPDFTERFLKRSSARPRLLLTLVLNDKLMFYSIPQDRDPNLTTSRVVPYYHMSFPKGDGNYNFEICTPLRGLVCSKTKKPLIYNPSTGEYLTLPTATRERVAVKTYLGFDPLDKIYKVLGVTYDSACRVLTLGSFGTKQVSWRTIECAVPHKPLHDAADICFNGVLYYLAQYGLGHVGPDKLMLVLFDIRSEKFKFIGVDNRFLFSTALINFQGKLGAIWPGRYSVHNAGTQVIKLWVLEEGDEMKWSETVYNLPSFGRFLADGTRLCILGMTAGGEIVLSSYLLRDTVYVIYYDVVKKTTASVEIHFGEVAPEARSRTFMDHVENVELLMG